MRIQRGYTLVELSITVTVVVVLLVIAVPNFSSMLRGQQIKNAALDVASTITFARSEAVKRNTLVNVTAATTGWKGGWAVAPASASTIRSHDAFSGVAITEANGNTQFQFGGNGRMQQPLNLKFTVAPATSTAHVQPLCISVGTTGRAQTTTGACS